MLNLEWFRTFKVVYEAGTLSAAAELLFISQPGVSLHLTSLESYTGFRLFERDSRKVSPTDKGKNMYNFIVDALLNLEEVEQRLRKKNKTGRPTLSLGMCYTTFQHVLESQICNLPFNLISKYGESSAMLDQLANGSLDLVISPHDSPRPNLVYKAFSNERLLLICGGQTDTKQLEQFVHDGNKSALKRWLRKQRWFSTSADMEYLKSFWMMNFKELPDFSPDYILPHFSSILRCLDNGAGFAVVPDYLFHEAVKTKTIRLAWEGFIPTENTLYFAKRKRPSFAEEIEFLEKLLVSHWFDSRSAIPPFFS